MNPAEGVWIPRKEEPPSVEGLPIATHAPVLTGMADHTRIVLAGARVSQEQTA